MKDLLVNKVLFLPFPKIYVLDDDYLHAQKKKKLGDTHTSFIQFSQEGMRATEKF